MAKRRGRGEGSITKRKDGRWMARVDLGWQNGRRRRKTIYGRTRREVTDQLPTVLHNAQRGTLLADERQTVGQFLAAWLVLKQSQLRPRAYASYEQMIRQHIEPGLGRHRLSRLAPQNVAAWFRRHQEDGASARTIRYARTVLRAALNQAFRWGLVTRNAAALVDAPRHQAQEISPLAPDQARTLLKVATDQRLGALVSAGMALGLRLGEVLGLHWAEVDFDKHIVRVRWSLERSGGDGAVRRPLVIERRNLLEQFDAAPRRSQARREVRRELEALRVRWREHRTTLRLTEPKSVRSRRTIRMPGVVRTALKVHRRRQLEERLAAGSTWNDADFVFASPSGMPLDPRNVTREFHTLLRAAQLPPMRFHDLRHTAATLLLAQGVDARTIMETLGHSQIALTLNTYSHVLPTLQEDAAEKLDAILGL